MSEASWLPDEALASLDDADEFCPLDIVEGFWLGIAAEPCPLADGPAGVE